MDYTLCSRVLKRWFIIMLLGGIIWAPSKGLSPPFVRLTPLPLPLQCMRGHTQTHSQAVDILNGFSSAVMVSYVKSMTQSFWGYLKERHWSSFFISVNTHRQARAQLLLSKLSLFNYRCVLHATLCELHLHGRGVIWRSWHLLGLCWPRAQRVCLRGVCRDCIWEMDAAKWTTVLEPQGMWIDRMLTERGLVNGPRCQSWRTLCKDVKNLTRNRLKKGRKKCNVLMFCFSSKSMWLEKPIGNTRTKWINAIDPLQNLGSTRVQLKTTAIGGIWWSWLALGIACSVGLGLCHPSALLTNTDDTSLTHSISCKVIPFFY